MHAVLERVVSQIATEVYALDAESAQNHPHCLAYKWTAQQVVEHLVLGYQQTTRALHSRLQKGRLPRSHKCTYLQWSLQLMILTFGYLPHGVPALDETLPAGHFEPMNGRQLGDLLRDEGEAMDAALDACRRKFGMERVSVHPWLGPLRVDQWRRFHALHGLHHVVQLRSVIAAVAPSRMVISAPSPRLVEKLQVPVQRSLT
jgi:hypothetical protein